MYRWGMRIKKNFLFREELREETKGKKRENYGRKGRGKEGVSMEEPWCRDEVGEVKVIDVGFGEVGSSG